MNACELYDRTIQPRDTVRVARESLLDSGCFDPEWVELLNEVGVVEAVDRFFIGGWIAFAQEEGRWSGLTPREREALPREGECPTQCPLCGEISRLCKCE